MTVEVGHDAAVAAPSAIGRFRVAAAARGGRLRDGLARPGPAARRPRRGEDPRRELGRRRGRAPPVRRRGPAAAPGRQRPPRAGLRHRRAGRRPPVLRHVVRGRRHPRRPLAARPAAVAAATTCSRSSTGSPPALAVLHAQRDRPPGRQAGATCSCGRRSTQSADRPRGCVCSATSASPRTSSGPPGSRCPRGRPRSWPPSSVDMAGRIRPATDVHAFAMTVGRLLGIAAPWPDTALGEVLRRADGRACRGPDGDRRGARGRAARRARPGGAEPGRCPRVRSPRPPRCRTRSGPDRGCPSRRPDRRRPRLRSGRRPRRLSRRCAVAGDGASSWGARSWLPPPGPPAASTALAAHRLARPTAARRWSSRGPGTPAGSPA